MIYIHKLAKERNLDYNQLVTVHDEIQFQVLREHVEQFGSVCKEAMKMVEKTLKVKCPLDCSWQTGDDWSLCH